MRKHRKVIVHICALWRSYFNRGIPGKAWVVYLFVNVQRCNTALNQKVQDYYIISYLISVWKKKNISFLSPLLLFIYLPCFCLFSSPVFISQKTLVWVILDRPPKAAFAQNIGTEQVQCLSETQAKFSFWEVTELILKERKKELGIWLAEVRYQSWKEEWGLRSCEGKGS